MYLLLRLLLQLGGILLWLLCQPGEKLCVLGYAMLLLWLLCQQERINTSAVPMDPLVSFQPLSSYLASPGFNEQCT